MLLEDGGDRILMKQVDIRKELVDYFQQLYMNMGERCLDVVVGVGTLTEDRKELVEGEILRGGLI